MGLRIVVSTLVAVLAGLVWTAAALAVPPTLRAVGDRDRHAVAVFSAPRADFVTIYLASKPDRATDGSFLQENVKALDSLTDSEIQSGQWSDESQIDPGTYWVMLRASPDFDSCYLLESGTYDPACADGFSNTLTLVVPKPSVRYAGRATVYRYLGQASLRLIATPLGERRPYRLCYRLKSGRTRCLNGALAGYDWNSPAEDTLTVSTRNLPRIADFSWYVGGNRIATRRVRIR
jgi:hypothetical protein